MTIASWGCFFDGKPKSADTPKISFFTKNNTDQAIPHNTWTWLDLTVINHELPSGQVSLPLDRWTVPFDGHYCITSHIQMDVLFGQSTVAIEFHRNGVLQCQSTEYNSFSSIHALNLVTSDQMTAAEYWQVRIFQNSGFTAYLLSSTCNQNQFTGFCNYLL